MQKMFKLVLVVIVLFNAILTVRSITCPKADVMKNFDLKKFMGKWYEIQKYFNPHQAGMKCFSADYTLDTDGTVGIVYSSLVKKTNAKFAFKGTGTPSDSDPAQWKVEYENIAQEAGTYVVDTDYTNYALTYDCFQAPDSQAIIEFAWIMSRTPTLSADIMEKMKQKLKSFKSDVSKLVMTDRNGC